MKPVLSVVVPTRNEETNVGTCLDAFRHSHFADCIELIVVDNDSPDRTREIAAERGARVFLQGPERCAQRNRGWRESQGDWVLFLDADMIMPSATIDEMLREVSGESACDAYFIPEHRSGIGLRAKARNFERGFYDGTCIDGLRLMRRTMLEQTGGYDENLVACEDWDLDRRLMALGASTGTLNGHLVHNERSVPLSRLLAKKAYYSGSVGRYREKWHNDEVVRRQFGLGYRYFGVFVENGKWRRILRHPLLAAVMYFERVMVGLVYLMRR